MGRNGRKCSGNAYAHSTIRYVEDIFNGSKAKGNKTGIYDPVKFTHKGEIKEGWVFDVIITEKKEFVYIVKLKTPYYNNFDLFQFTQEELEKYNQNLKWKKNRQPRYLRK